MALKSGICQFMSFPSISNSSSTFLVCVPCVIVPNRKNQKVRGGPDIRRVAKKGGEKEGKKEKHKKNITKVSYSHGCVDKILE